MRNKAKVLKLCAEEENLIKSCLFKIRAVNFPLKWARNELDNTFKWYKVIENAWKIASLMTIISTRQFHWYLKRKRKKNLYGVHNITICTLKDLIIIDFLFISIIQTSKYGTNVHLRFHFKLDWMHFRMGANENERNMQRTEK